MKQRPPSSIERRSGVDRRRAPAPWPLARRWTALRLAASVGLLALVAGCSSLPPTHYYVLELAAARPGGPAAAAGAPSVGVRPFLVEPPYDQDRIVYRVGEDSPEVGFYAYHHWAAPLQSMLPGMVASGLAGTEGLGAIEPAAPGRRYDAMLAGRLQRAEEIDLPDRQSVRVVLDLRLLDADGEELWATQIDARGNAATADVAAVVEAMRQSLQAALAAERPALGRALTAAAPSSAPRGQ